MDKKENMKDPEGLPEVQWLRLQAPNAGGLGSIPGWGTKILHAATKTQLSQINK